MDLQLTDDEVIALSMSRALPWPTGLPTVDIEDGKALLGAALRGRRSLGVRGLLDPDPDSAEDDVLKQIRQHVVGRKAFACLYLADADGSRSADSVNLNAYPAQGKWAVETVSDNGVHQVSILSREQVRNLYSGLASAAHEQGLAESRTARTLVVAAVSEQRPVSFEVRRGQHDRVSLQDDRALPTGYQPTVLTDVERILEHTTAAAGAVAASKE